MYVGRNPDVGEWRALKERRKEGRKEESGGPTMMETDEILLIPKGERRTQ